VKKGSKPKVPYLGDHIRESIVGAVNPKAGAFFSLVVPQSDSDIFQAFLDEFTEHTSGKEKGKKTILIIDNASRHKNSSIAIRSLIADEISSIASIDHLLH